MAKKVVLELMQEGVKDPRKLLLVRNRVVKAEKGPLPRSMEMIEAYRQLLEEGAVGPSSTLMGLLQKRKVRTMSGIANITVLTQDLGCPGLCIFCPTEKGMPKSYLSNEPAMLRAVRNDFDAYKQVKTRLNGLVAQGHDVTKIDVRTAGGTWGAVPLWYQERFIKAIYLALNEGPGPLREVTVDDLKAMDLNALIRQNETATCRCVGLWVETRPDWVNEEEVRRLRGYGVTGVELGVQTTDDAVNAFNKRGHGVAESVAATVLLRNAGFKVCHHLMPNLPTATWESDVKSGVELFSLEGLRPDYLKIYPCVVTPYSDLEQMLKKDPVLHTPYGDAELVQLLLQIKREVPEYCRIIRVIRDIPAESIVLGSKTSNLRQNVQAQGFKCRCIRCREIQDMPYESDETTVVERAYKAGGGVEHFFSVEAPRLDKLIALVRLFLPDPMRTPLFAELKGAALVRELHVYGRQESLTESAVASKTQHRGFGKQLMAEAEQGARRAGYAKIAVIAATGTREYYKKLGYALEGTYMTKAL